MQSENFKTWSDEHLLRYMENLTDRDPWTDATAKEFDAAHDELNRRRARKAATAKPVRRMEPGDDGEAGFGSYVRALAMGRGDPLAGAAHARHAGLETVARGLEAGSAAGGGFLVPEEHSREVVQALRARAVVFRAGPRVLPMSGTELTIPKVSLGVSGSYLGESADIAAEAPTFGALRLTAKKLACLVPISNDLLRSAEPQADQIVRDDIVAGLQVTADAALIRSDGSGAAPKGLRYWAGSVTTTSGASAVQIEEDLLALLGALQDGDSPMVRPVWLMAPRSHRRLYNLRDSNGNLIFPEIRQVSEMAPEGLIYGFPVYTTTSIPTNLGGGTESEVYLVDMDSVVIGQQMSVAVQVSDSASYFSGGGLVSAWSRDQTVIRAITCHDLVVRHAASVAVRTGITWGA